MVTVPIDPQSQGSGLFDRLAAGAATLPANSADRAKLRPLLPYHAHFPPFVSAEDQEALEDATGPSWKSQMPHEPGATLPDRALDARHMTDAPTAAVNAKEPPAQRAASEARVAESARIAAERRLADSGDVTPSVVRPRPSPQGTQPSRRAADVTPPPRSTTEPGIRVADVVPASRERGIRAPEIPAPVPGRSVLDTTVRSEPHREQQPERAMQRQQLFPEPARTALRSRDVSSVSSPHLAPRRAEPTIEIHIGRVEVRAQIAASPPAPPSPRATAPSASALAAYLGARGRGARS
jgi:hypothetical protein